jgi:hypothetical protein
MGAKEPTDRTLKKLAVEVTAETFGPSTSVDE